MSIIINCTISFIMAVITVFIIMLYLGLTTQNPNDLAIFRTLGHLLAILIVASVGFLIVSLLLILCKGVGL